MFGRLWKAIGNLIANVEALASTFGEANVHVRSKLGLDVQEPMARIEDSSTAAVESGKRSRKAS